MGEKDISEKMLADHNDVFADIVNVLLFNGRNIIHEEELLSTKDKSQYKADGKLHEQERDLSKIWQKCNIKISFIGMENQTSIDDYMPLRVIGYDGAVYRSQYKGNDTKAYPVITIVLNFSKAKWEKNKNLSDIMNVPVELKPYFHDYGINVFDICYLSREQVKMFQSDFGIVAEYFVETTIDSENYMQEQKTIKHVNEILKLMKILTGDSRYEEVANDLTKKGGDVTMCEVLDRVEKRGIQQGIQQGEFKILVKLVSDGTITIPKAAKEAGMDEAAFEARMKEIK